MKRVVLKRYEEAVCRLKKAKSTEDIAFLTGFTAGIRSGLFLGTDMSLDEFKELVELEESGMIRRECELCFDKTFENEDGQLVSCHHTGYEVHFAGDFTGDNCCWWNEYEDVDGNLYYGR